MSTGEVILPKNEKLQYRVIQLPNALKAVLVHDPEADKAAASLDVNVGSMLDPPEFPGLAHFTEHMLFYSSVKYPEEDAYSKFVEDHGGRTNAWTASEHTNYHFDVNWDNLEPTLDRFAQFFIGPLISSEGVEREIKAVDAEHSKNVDSDAWRLMQLHKHTANQAHPWSRFATGNLLTLGTEPKSKGLNIREGVVDFHSKWYSSNLMRLAVVSRHTLDELEVMVRSFFSEVKNKELDVPQMPSNVFLPEHCCKLMCVVPVREVHALEFAWQVPPSAPQYKATPLNYLSHLLGHEGTGSLFALLKDLGWASSLVAGESGISISSASFFYVRVEMTDEGHSHAREISALLFKYFNLLKGSEGVSSEIFEEMQALQRLRFEFRDKQSPYGAASGLSSALQLYPSSDLLLAIYHVPTEYHPEMIREALDLMVPETVRVTWTSKKLKEDDTRKLDQSEPWYGTQFSFGDIPPEWLSDWADGTTDSRLHLPTPNPFVPTNFTLHDAEATDKDAPPTLAVDVAGRMAIYHKCDLTFSMPKANIYLDFQCPEAYASPDNVVMTRIFVKLLSDYLNEMAYPAELAGLAYSVSNSQAGFQVVVSGYNHKLLSLLDAILEKMVHFEMKDDRFSVVRENTAKEYLNMKYQQPYQWAMYRKELMLTLKRWPVEDYIESIKDVSAADVSLFVRKTMLRCFVQGLVVGNMPRAEVLTLSQHIMTQMSSVMGTRTVFPSQTIDYRTLKAPQGPTTLLVEAGPNPTNDNSAIVAAYQVGPDNMRINALTQLLVHLAKRDAFNQLRTQQQLGYIVSLFTNHDLCVYDIEVVVQSNSFSAAVLSERVETFIQNFVDVMLEEKCRDPSEKVVEAGEKVVEEKCHKPSEKVVEAEKKMVEEAEAGEKVADAEEKVAEAKEKVAEAGGETVSEFTKAIEELTKSKLEKPKTLAEISRRLWHEVTFGTLMFNRQEAEVAELRSITPAELCSFAASVLRSETRRKVLVAVCGSAESARALESASAPDAASGQGTTEDASDGAAAVAAAAAAPAATKAAEEAVPAADVAKVVAVAAPVDDFKKAGLESVSAVDGIQLFKRSCEVWPNVAAMYKRQLKM